MNLVSNCENIIITQIGCGGTGSWLVPLISKLLNNIRLRLPTSIKIIYNLIDDDAVETQNIQRQNFDKWDIGKSKTIALNSKYCYIFDNIFSIISKIKRSDSELTSILLNKYNNSISELEKTLVIVIGCVDNNKTRRLINRSLKKINLTYLSPIVYIDSGNLLYNGQILTLSYGFNEFLIETLSKFDISKAETIKNQIKKNRKINFNKMFSLNEETANTQSCAFFGDQSQAINSLAATLIFCNLQKILVASELPPQLITFNSSGYSTFEV